MKILVFLCICALANSIEYSALNYSTHLAKLSSPEYYANNILQHVTKNNTNQRITVSNACIEDLIAFALALSNGDEWAFRMFDANAKLPAGLLQGYASNLGSYDECLNINAQLKNNKTVNGKYCLGTLPVVDVAPKITYSNVHNRMMDLEAYKISFLWGICLPDSCSSADFANLSFIIPFQVSSNSCQTAASSNIKFDAGDYGAIVFFSIVLVLIALSTGYEIFHLFIKKKPCSSILNAFSVITNTLRIVEVKKDKDEITCLHGMRVFSLIFLMYGFTYGLQILSPLENLLDFLSWITNRLITVYFEGILVIDTFFFISGLLVSYKYLKLESKGIEFNIFVYYLKRVLRLTPALFAIVLLNATLMRHMGSGPIWPLMRSTLLVDNCRENWWSTLLYVQNYATPNNTCLLQSWHLAVDMQLYVVSPLLLILFKTGPLVSFISYGLIIIGAVITSFVIAWKYEIKSLFLINILPENHTTYMTLIFYSIQTRIPPWIMGFGLGYILYKCKNKSSREKVNKYCTPMIACLSWILAFGLIVICFASPAIVEDDFHPIKSPMHVSMIRIAWSIALSWFTFACMYGFSGPVNHLLSLPILQVISKISYCTFLTNMTVMTFASLQMKTGVHFSNIDVLHKFWPNLVYSLFIGFIWTLAFESPMIALQKFSVSRISKITDPVFTFHEQIIERFKGNRKSKPMNTKL